MFEDGFTDARPVEARRAVQSRKLIYRRGSQSPDRVIAIQRAGLRLSDRSGGPRKPQAIQEAAVLTVDDLTRAGYGIGRT